MRTIAENLRILNELRKYLASVILSKGVYADESMPLTTLVNQVNGIPGIPKLQEKQARSSSVCQYIRPDSGYDGLNCVVVFEMDCPYLLSVGVSDGDVNAPLVHWFRLGVGESIPAYAFNRHERLVEVGINSGVKCIEKYSFHMCKSLTRIRIPDTITKIDDHAFQSSGLESIVIPDSVTSLGSEATFYGCDELKSVTLGKSLTKIPNMAFFSCGRLKTITIPNNINTIESEAFRYSGLESIVIPSSVTTMGTGVFRECESLTSVTFENANLTDGEIPYETCRFCDNLISVKITQGITTIGVNAFSNCPNLKTVLLPDSITLIKGSFSICENLTDIYYTGTQEQWEAITIYYNELENATIHYNWNPDDPIPTT